MGCLHAAGVSKSSMHGHFLCCCRKLALKLVQRIGLAFLPARPPAWRYQRTCLDIASTLGATPGPGEGSCCEVFA